MSLGDLIMIMDSGQCYICMCNGKNHHQTRDSREQSSARVICDCVVGVRENLIYIPASRRRRDHRNLWLGEYFNRQSVSVSHISIDEESVTVAHSSLTFNSSKIHLPRNQPSFVVCLCSPTQCTLSVGGFKRLIRHSYWLLALVVVCPGQKLSNSHAISLYSLYPCI